MNQPYCDIVEVCDFIGKFLSRPFTSYGIEQEWTFDLKAHARGDLPGSVAPSPKPIYLLRGQTKAYPALQSSLFRKYPFSSTWHKSNRFRIGDDSLLMPNPHYCPDLERDFHFSCIKAAEMTAEIQFPKSINGHALCQHYGLVTHYLDFTEDVWIAGFFASHDYPTFKPLEEGIGVIYVLDTDKISPKLCHEIGIQALARPFAQRGWLLQTYPGLNYAEVPAVSAIYFKHVQQASKQLGKRFDAGKKLLPDEQLPAMIQRLNQPSVKSSAFNRYLKCYPNSDRTEIERSVRSLFCNKISITPDS